MKLVKNKSGISIAFSVFIMFVVIFLFAIVNFALAPIMDITADVNNRYMEENPEKYMPEVRQNQNACYLFYDNMTIVVLLTLASYLIINAIKRNWDEQEG